jgi:hypothetical protein
MDRREFLARAGLAVAWAAIPIAISSCSKENGPSDPVNPADEVGVVSPASGHTHDGAVVTEAQLLAGGAVTLALTGAGHTHTVALTSQDVADIAGGLQVIALSSTDVGHAHTVTFN